MSSAWTVHVVDDDEGVRESVAALLEADGYRVKAHCSGDSFLEQLDELDPGCVLLDIHMPGRSGLEVQRELAAREAELPVVVMTGQGDIGLAVKVMKAGASDFVEKPYSNETLLDTLNSALGELEASRGEQEKIRAARAKIDRLSPREVEVVRGLLAGLPRVETHSDPEGDGDGECHRFSAGRAACTGEGPF